MRHNIDLSNWKLTLPETGIKYTDRAMEIQQPELHFYRTNELLKEYFYDDEDGALVFFAKEGATTPNTVYYRTELREQLKYNSDKHNWSLSEGGHMTAVLKIDEVSKKSNGRTHDIVFMQVHGVLSRDYQTNLKTKISTFSPCIKVKWVRGYIVIGSKRLKDINTPDEKLTNMDSWEDSTELVLPTYVGYEKFKLEIICREGSIEVVLNDDESILFDSIHMKKWNAIDNFFKAGNYFQSTDKGSFSKVRFYQLYVKH